MSALQKKERPEFQGVPLMEMSKAVPVVNFLKGDYGRDVLDRFESRARSAYGNARVLTVLNYNSEAGLVTGSNPFAVVLVNQIVGEDGLRAATQADLEKILKLGALDLRGTYEDSGLVLRSEGDPNSYLAKNLFQQIKSVNKRAKFPVMIPLTSIDIAVDQSSSYGLALKLKEDAKVFYAPVLSRQGQFTSESIDEKTGLPKKTGNNGQRTLYTRAGGLSRLYLDRGLYVHSNGDDLASSVSDGRVVVVSGEAAPKNFEAMLTREFRKEQTALEQKYQRALAVLRS